MRRVTIGLCFFFAACPTTPEEVLVCPPDQVDVGGECLPADCGTDPFGGAAEDAVFAAPAPLGTEDGDGTREAPFARIGPAVDRAFASGIGVVRLSGGTFVDSLSFGRTADGVRVVGRCPELTILDGGGSASATVTVHADGVQLTGLTITGGAPGIAVLPSDEGGVARLAATDLVLLDNAFAGLVVSGDGDVEADLRDSSVTGTVPRAPDGDAHALLVEGGARLGAVGVSIRGNTGVGVGARGDGSLAELDDVEVVSLEPFPDGRPAVSVQASAGAAVLAVDVLSTRTVGRGLHATGPGSLIELRDGVVRDTTPAGTRGGESVVAEDGGRVVLEGVTPLRSVGPGWWAARGAPLPFASADVTQMVAADPRVGAVGIRVGEGAVVTGATLFLPQSPGPGVVVEAGGEFDCTDCTIRQREFAGIVALPVGTVRLRGGALTSTGVSEALGGGVGVLGLSDGIEGPTIEILETGLSDHAGPAVLLQGGPATLLLSGASIERSGSGGADLPRAGLVARDGVGRWSGEVGSPDADGLWIRRNLFRDLGGDAILLHAASATVDTNTFEDVGEAALRVQSCGGVSTPEIVGPEPSSVLCEGAPLPLGATLIYPGM